VHTHYSIDSLISPKELVFYAKKAGLDGVAVTDHDTLAGALKMAKETDFLIVPGMEVTSLDGHVIGLNAQELIPRGLSADETVDKIHEAGGLAVACHLGGFFKESLGKHVTAKFDAVEVMNSSAIPFSYATKRSEQIASRLDKPRVAGSDAHYAPEIGCAYTVIDAEANVEDVVKAIGRGSCQPFGKAIPWSVRIRRIMGVYRRGF